LLSKKILINIYVIFITDKWYLKLVRENNKEKVLFINNKIDIMDEAIIMLKEFGIKN